MELYDPKLKFARDLIGHWLGIRGGALVPLDDDIDPRPLQPCIDQVGILDLTQPAQMTIELAGAGLIRRFGGRIRHLNWLDLVPPTLGDAGERAREHIRNLPCGYYHEFTVACDRSPSITAQALALPLRYRVGTRPQAAIVITRDDSGSADGRPIGWLTSLARVEHFYFELVDIGAGVRTHD
jgi:hypothetical protein